MTEDCNACAHLCAGIVCGVKWRLVDPIEDGMDCPTFEAKEEELDTVR